MIFVLLIFLVFIDVVFLLLGIFFLLSKLVEFLELVKIFLFLLFFINGIGFNKVDLKRFEKIILGIKILCK